MAKSWRNDGVVSEKIGTSGILFPEASNRKKVRNGGIGPYRKANDSPVSGSVFGCAVMLMNSFPPKSHRPHRHYIAVVRDFHGVWQIGLSDGVKLAGEGSRGGDGSSRRRGGEAVEAGEDVGDDWRAGLVLDCVFVGFDEAAAEGGAAAGDLEGVEHAVAVEEVIGPAGKELGVGAVSDVHAAVEAWRQGALGPPRMASAGAPRRGEVVREDVARVHRLPDRRVDEGVDEAVERVEDSRRH
ncbi:nine-cis-epoxycarotenoid dioxygenase 4 [Actinidia rufa]|uniref:Nine-cis-epoxycarotenoid dioxygenase 4 n=1 Tax=Actinidia rufa TaxID=165716 RepID=A0A7J0F936_9ERIC|nr:nine-cis-epoxycarotenoid dioxygenase 4 [Actinidia rufa]